VSAVFSMVGKKEGYLWRTVAGACVVVCFEKSKGFCESVSEHSSTNAYSLPVGRSDMLRRLDCFHSHVNSMDQMGEE
jgi:hypothetical protein